MVYGPEQASEYAKFIKSSYSWIFMEKPALVKHLKPLITSKTKALDAGCGTGHSTKLLVELGIKKKNILGVDISPDMLVYARKFLPKVKFMQKSLPELKLRSSSLDLILSVMVFQFLKKNEYEKMIESFYKVLVKGGCLFFITLHPVRFAHDHENYFEEKLKIEKTPWGTEMEYQHRTITDYLKPIIEIGFELKLVEEIIPVKRGATKDRSQYDKYSSVPTRLAVMAKKK